MPNEIERLIPHRGRMKLVNTIIEADDKVAVTESLVTEHWPLVVNGSAGPLVLIELVAQTSAVCIGWKELEDSPEKGKGWLVGIKSADFHTEAIPAGTRLRTRTQIRFSIDNYTEISGCVYAEKNCLADIVLQVMKDEGIHGDERTPAEGSQ